MYGFDIDPRRQAHLEDTAATVDCRCRDKQGLSDQKVNLSENWAWRAVPPPICVPSASAMVWPTRPKLPLGVQVPGPTAVQIPPSGLVKLGWLKMLKMSARNCIDTLSVMAKFFIPERSNWKYAGPRRALRPTVPIVPPGVPSYVGSMAKASRL